MATSKKAKQPAKKTPKKVPKQTSRAVAKSAPILATSSGSTAPRTRKLKPGSYRTLRLSRRIKHPSKPLPSAYAIFKMSLKQLIKNWRLFGGITAIYIVLIIILVKGFGSTNNIAELKANLQNAFGGSASNIKTSLTLFGALLSNIGSSGTSVNAYQTMVLLIISLVLIWALRQTTTLKKQMPSVRDAFYKGLYPLIPFVLVVVVIELQLVPLLVANFIANGVFGGGLAVTVLEKSLWLLLCVILCILSFYMVTSSLFAMYIVTLPDLRPMAALRSARELVRYRRLLVLRKILFLPVALLVLAAVIMIPLIMVVPAVAEWVFFALSMVALAVFHSYIYNLYRALL